MTRLSSSFPLMHTHYVKYLSPWGLLSVFYLLLCLHSLSSVTHCPALTHSLTRTHPSNSMQLPDRPYYYGEE